MRDGGFVEVAQEPQYQTVEEYIKYLKYNSPNLDTEKMLREADIECTCCKKKAPHVAAAFLKIEDKTPVSVDLSGTPGTTMWLCANCFNYGVRPKYVRYGNIRWNKEGRRVQKRMSTNRGHPLK